jgi:2-iminobutanoate/2-iminopropanoate deaminase
MGLGELVKLTVYLVGEWDTDARRALVAARLGSHRPCVTLIFVAALASPQLRVELDAWASSEA